MRPLCLIFLLMACARPAEAAGPERLQKAELAFEDLEFEQAARLFREALGGPGTREERVRAYRGLALSLAFVGDAQGARASFEILLLIEPEAKVEATLGPKVLRPFEAARRAVKGKRPLLLVHRDESTGEVTAEVSRPFEPLRRISLELTPAGQPQRSAEEPGNGPLVMQVPPHLEVTAWAEAKDDAGGTLLTSGSSQAPLRFVATAFAPPQQVAAVTVAVEEAKGERNQALRKDARWEATQQPRPTRWPLWLGAGGALLGGGVAAALLLRPPAPLELPAAHRTGRLP